MEIWILIFNLNHIQETSKTFILSYLLLMHYYIVLVKDINY